MIGWVGVWCCLLYLGGTVVGIGRFFLVLLLVLPVLAGCGGDSADVPTPEIEGPALIMFYTDN